MEFDGAIADAHCVRDFRDAESLDVEQRQCQSLLARQCRQQCREIGAIGPVDGCGAFLDLQQFDGALLAAQPTVFIAELIDGDPSNPPDRIVVVAHPAPVEVRFDESLLHGVGSGFSLTAYDRERAY